MTGLRILGVSVLLVFVAVALAAASTRGQLPSPATADCGESGVAGIGFTAFACESGAGATKYAHPAELLVIRADGTHTGYPDTFSQPNLMARSATGEVVAAHNDSIVRVTASALKTLINERGLDQLFLGGSGVAGIDALTVTRSGEIIFRVNYYAANKHGCGNVRAELTARGQVKPLWRSATGLTCG